MNKPAYSTSMTGAGFLMHEYKQITILKQQGHTDEEIRTKILDENIFQYRKMASIKRALPYLLKRVNVLDETLQKMVAEEPTNVGKVINFYSIVKTDQLFFEFIEEVVYPIIVQGVGELEKKDVNVFFKMKAEQSDFVKNLAESTEKRLKSAYLKMLLEVGILKDLKSREVRRLVIDDNLKSYFIQIGEVTYLKVIGEDV